MARLLALAHKFQRMLESGEVESMAELARLGRVSRARITQIMDLMMLAPEIQEEMLLGTFVGRHRNAPGWCGAFCGQNNAHSFARETAKLQRHDFVD